MFNKYPYTDNNQLNLDWFLEKFKELYDAWVQFKAETEQEIDDFETAMRNDFNDLLTQFEDFKTFVTTYLDNLDYAGMVADKIEEMVDNGSFLNLMRPAISSEVTTWLSDHIEPTTPPVDDTLTIAGAAADAKVTGDEIRTIKRNSTPYDYETLSFTVIQNEYINQNTGEFVSYANWSRTGYIEVDPSETLFIESSVNSQYCAQYDENHNFIQSLNVHAGFEGYALHANTKYIALSSGSAVINDFYVSYIYSKDNKPFIESVEYLTSAHGIIPVENWHLGNIDSTTGDYVFSWYSLVSDKISIVGAGTYKLTIDNSKWRVYFSVYDNNDNLIRQTNYLVDGTEYQFDYNASYIRAIAGHTNVADYILPSEKYAFTIALKRNVYKNIKVMTYNMGHYNYGINYGIPDAIYDEKLTNYRRFFAKENCDIVGIEEYDSRMDTANTIWSADVLWNYQFPFMQQAGSWCAIQSLLRLADSSSSKQLSTGRYYAEGYINDIYILVVHLSVGVGAEATRLQEADEILTLLAPHETFILFGDFNCEPNEEDNLYSKFTNAGYSLANCGWFGKFYTWSSNRADFDDYDNPTGTIYYLDNIIVSSNIKIKNVYPIPEAYDLLSSDHIPLVAELELNS